MTATVRNHIKIDTIFDHNKRYRYLILISFLDIEEKLVIENNPTTKVSLRPPAEAQLSFISDEINNSPKILLQPVRELKHLSQAVLTYSTHLQSRKS